MTSSRSPRAWRACLSVPGSSERMLAKAAALDVDAVVLDLEDAVAPAAKHDARALVAAALGEHDWGATTVAVRVNAPRSPWCHEDLLALAALPRPAAAVVPKVESAGDVAFVERLLDGAEAAAGGRTAPLRVHALIETAAGLARAGEIAAASPRLEALVLGYADLAASLGRGAAAREDLRAWDPARHALLVAARANGLLAIDGPHLGIEPDDAFHAAATHARELGFDGKWAIHPSQVAPLTACFTPAQEEVTWARRVVAALAEAEREGGRGAVALDGQMLDEAVRLAALRVLARAGEGAA